MGLDMYLNANRYLSTHNSAEKVISQRISVIIGIDPDSDRHDAFGRVKEINIEVGYWRKANAIHAWFVKNVQDGEDECQNSSVEREQLKCLRDLCSQVLSDPKLAPELLPFQEDFFFVSNTYDEYYLGNLQDTINIIDKALTLPGEWSIEYEASW